MDAQIINLAEWKAKHPPVEASIQVGVQWYSYWVSLWFPWIRP